MTQPWAYFNEIDKHAAQWLRNLMAAGHIAPGFVDDRSITDVRPYDLRGFTQCHFFAGIGVWSHALRRAGWRDDRRVWTGSCPCQPFSSAGSGLGFVDERHLWPHWYHLIDQRNPPVILGEQVASKDAEPWLDLVQDDLEGMGYAFGAVAFPAASVGAPHIRDRTYFVAHRDAAGLGAHALTEFQDASPHAQSRRSAGQLADSGSARLEVGGQQLARQEFQTAERGGDAGGRLGHTVGLRWRQGGCDVAGGASQDGERSPAGCGDAGPTRGFWAPAEWLPFRDGKARPVEPGAFPLANGVVGRVGRLRAYGNAIVAPQAQAWIEVVMECMP